MAADSIFRESQPALLKTVSVDPTMSLLLEMLLLSLVSIVGTYIRLSSTLLFTIESQAVPLTSIPQIIGAFILGLVHKHTSLHQTPSYRIVAVGLCGAIAAYSSTTLYTYLELTGLVRDRGAFHNILAGIESFLGIFGLAAGALVLGRALSPPIESVERFISRIERVPVRIAALALAVMTVTLIAVSIAVPSSLAYTLAGLLSPFGKLSKTMLMEGTLVRCALKPFNRSVPFGTLSANLIGILILALLIFISFHDMSTMSCNVIKAFMNGFCGCLTTLSSVIQEMYDIASSERKHSKKAASFYILVSFSSGLIILFICISISTIAGEYDYTSGCNVLSQYKSF